MSCERDRAILNSILNPFLPVGTEFDTEEPTELKDDVGEVTNEVVEAKKIERKAVQLAESGNVDQAIRDLTAAMTMAPHLPSLFNNRAQAYRLIGDTEKAMKDLNEAISLSKGKGKSACQAYCQRGLLHRKQGHDEKALTDFKNAADLGSSFAKMALIQMNPYAALCNQMLAQVMEKLQNGSQED
ncbi:UNVERIFIED_CONTAM: hypothetical protein PYX00_010374 [Menopon gallinae]|uniref:Tetratricopeptide repeat protein 36 n=1 Tax=Menopon gallinae TaxID=328185 RepID=A0AAW2HFY7_9NEOP